jgi:hypothetical protein
MTDKPFPPALPLKKAYVKPKVKRVPLQPEEAVLGFCKNDVNAGPLSASCSTPTPCFSSGS